MFCFVAGGVACALADGAMSQLFGGVLKSSSSCIQGDFLATNNNNVVIRDARIKSTIHCYNVPHHDDAVPSCVSRSIHQAGELLLLGPLPAGTSVFSDQLLVL